MELVGACRQEGLPWRLRQSRVCLQRGRPGFDPWVGKTPWRRNGYPLRYSCLESSMDGGAWRAVVHGGTKSRTGGYACYSCKLYSPEGAMQGGLPRPEEHRATEPAASPLPSATAHARFTELSKLVEGKGIPPSITPRNLSIHGLWDGKRGTQHCHFSKSHNTRDSQRISDDIQVSSACSHFPQH